MGIEKKSVGALIDELSVQNVRCWFAQEDVMRGGTDAEVAAAAVKAQTTNARRNQLMRAIDAYFDDPNAQLAKSYDHDVQVDPVQERLAALESDVRTLCDLVLHPTDTEKTRHFAKMLLRTLGEKST